MQCRPVKDTDEAIREHRQGKLYKYIYALVVDGVSESDIVVTGDFKIFDYTFSNVLISKF